MDAKAETWCDRDEHRLFEYYVDFNEWLDSDEAASVRERYGVDDISVPSKAFFAGDKDAYDQVFREYREGRRDEVLNKTYLCEQFTDNHWFERNLQRFDQLVEQLEAGNVAPFIGAGLSKAGGFPTWEDHLRSQGRTAGIDAAHTEDLLARGEYETVIAEIEASRGRDVFVQEVRDVFSRTGTLTDTTLLVTELFTDTVITTNYDRLIEQAFDTGANNAFQVINGLNALAEPDTGRVSIIKLHGDIVIPQHFAIEQAPETEQALSDRNAYLANLGITGIWFEKGQFGYVEDMLRLARNELRYRGGPSGGVTGKTDDAGTAKPPKSGGIAWFKRFLKR